MNIDDIIESAQLKGRVIALNAQVETLTAEVRCLEAVVRSHERVDCLTVANLKAEVERLQKANDSLAGVIDQLNAAKVGKQS
jgi:cell division protein FtsB